MKLIETMFRLIVVPVEDSTPIFVVSSPRWDLDGLVLKLVLGFTNIRVPPNSSGPHLVRKVLIWRSLVSTSM